jgi:hypothetical protein
MYIVLVALVLPVTVFSEIRCVKVQSNYLHFSITIQLDRVSPSLFLVKDNALFNYQSSLISKPPFNSKIC